MKSEIRESQVRGLLNKVRKESYAQYLRAIRLDRIRAFRGANIRFDFPVTALIGPNGAGKSTILGASACAYSSINPTNIFRKSRVGDEAMDDWLLEYDLVDKQLCPNGLVRRTLSFNKNAWLPADRPAREVKLFSINRTVPAIDNPSFSYRKTLSVHGKMGARKMDIATEEVPEFEKITRECERVLGRSLQDFCLLCVRFTSTKPGRSKRMKEVREQVEDLGNGRRRVTYRQVERPETAPRTSRGTQYLYVGENNGTRYSEFAFGSGESSVIRMIAEIEKLEDSSLVLIEEIENGLHPLAVTRMVEYLIDVAERKRLQVVFTTHSDSALVALPSEGIWSCLDGDIVQGKLSVEVLRAVSGRVDKRLAVFVEDKFAKAWIEAVVRERLPDCLDEIGIYPVHGDGNAVKTHRAHLQNPAVAFRSICYIDGDSREQEDNAHGIYRLPGAVPEQEVFDRVFARLDQNIAILTIGCQRAPTKQSEVAECIRSVSCTNRDPHVLFNQVGLRLGLVAEVIVQGAFLSVWMQECESDVATIGDRVRQALISADDE